MSVKRMKPRDTVRLAGTLQKRTYIGRAGTAAGFTPRNRAERRAIKRVAQ